MQLSAQVSSGAAAYPALEVYFWTRSGGNLTVVSFTDQSGGVTNHIGAKPKLGRPVDLLSLF